MSQAIETFFEKFGELADDGEALRKVRGLILDLGLQGKLTPHEPADQRDPTWQRLLESSVPDSSIADAPPFELPSEWVWAKVGSVATNCGQKVPAKRFTYIDVGAIDNETGTISDQAAVLEARDAPSRARKLVGLGAVIYSTVRPYLKNIAVIDREFDPEPIVSTAFAVMLPEPFLDTRFLFYWLRSSSFEQEVATRMKGVAYPAINDKEFRDCPIPLPPLAEQKRIVAKVDALMAQCDRLEEQLRERDTRQAELARAALARFAEAPTPTHLNLLFDPLPHSKLNIQHSTFITPADLRKTILTLAVQGKLVSQDLNDEPAEQLVKQILAERRKLVRTKEVELPPLTGLYDLPESWQWCRLDDILVFGPTNGFSPKAVDYETPVRSLTLSATTSGRFKGEHSKFIATDVPADSDLWLRDGDILVQRGNTIEYVGVPAVYRGEPNCFIYPDLMMKMRVSAALDVSFIHLAMSDEGARNFLRARASGTSGSMPKINQTTLKSLPIPIPPLPEQRRIVAKVDQLMALVDEWEARLTATRTTATHLLDALVAELTSSAKGATPSQPGASPQEKSRQRI